jgi:hypothetical protein
MKSSFYFYFSCKVLGEIYLLYIYIYIYIYCIIGNFYERDECENEN